MAFTQLHGLHKVERRAMDTGNSRQSHAERRRGRAKTCRTGDNGRAMGANGSFVRIARGTRWMRGTVRRACGSRTPGNGAPDPPASPPLPLQKGFPTMDLPAAVRHCRAPRMARQRAGIGQVAFTGVGQPARRAVHAVRNGPPSMPKSCTDFDWSPDNRTPGHGLRRHDRLGSIIPDAAPQTVDPPGSAVPSPTKPGIRLCYLQHRWERTGQGTPQP